MNNYKLNGEFKFKILDKDKNIRVESDYFPNFITSKGLSFPYHTGFAGLLNFFSAGTGTGYNYIGVDENLPTSGLYLPILESGFFNSTGFLKNGVGSVLTHSGVNFYKTWVLPDEKSVASKDYPIKEFSISAFTPNIIIDDQEVTEGNIYEEVFKDGVRQMEIIPKYSGGLTGIFSRATGNFELKSGEQMFVTYRLNLTFETGIKTFLNVVNTAGADKSKGTHLTFNHFSGIYSLTSPAVNFLFPLEGMKEGGDAKPGDVGPIEHMGLGMEPSTPEKNLFCYLSEDESQFLLKTSGVGGVFEDAEEYFAGGGWQNSSGIHKYIYNAPLEKDSIKTNIRRSGVLAPSTGDIFETKIGDGPFGTYDPYIFMNITSKILTQPQYFKIDGTDRERYILRSFSLLANENNLDRKFKSLVLGYEKEEGEGQEPKGKEIVPYIDCLFGTSANELKPNTGEYIKEGELFTGWFPNTGNYLNLDEKNNLTLTFKLKWSSPCSDAIDCS